MSGRQRSRRTGARRTSLFLTTLLGTAGIMHAVRPEPFDSIVPRALPGLPRAYTYASGIAEVATSALIAVPSTRRLGGLAAAALLVAVFPANVQMAIDWRDAPPKKQAIAFGRLPLQGVLVAQALHIARRG
ncbi:hypothetical protein [Brachybacterium muris]|uniref:DoxX family protein n=1 Tax=Brachybacterium muris TaxID=219301 RepID=UPI000DB6F5F3|nr:hypothetical protein [Brachybacterium muris]MCT1652955.1 hypothetical protein [Brachybacterium muris]PZP14064.1 MAG: hypothetical protein DI611_13020 [Brachybacterium faecium]